MPFNSSPFGGTLFNIVPIFIGVGFIFVIGMFILTIIKGVSTWKKNNAQPVLTVPAKVVSKRINTSSGTHNSGNDIHHHHHHTSYYVTFEVESGDRMEFSMDGHEYGLLAENDIGKLTFQGTRYHGFSRYVENVSL